MAEKTHKTGKKTRKYGRQEKSPAHMRYNQQKRWNINKRRRAEKRARKFGKPVKIKINGVWETVTA